MADAVNHIPCQRLVELVSDYLELALESEDAELFEQHLVYCEGCERYVDAMRRTIGIGAGLRDDAVPTATLERLLDEFRRERSS
ncbi:MAG TPA: zf-HC2 domain-containing protein [Solirubrobacterales bacterium]|jgi:predicted anti-sigma-YlaC factor YlaD